MLHQWGHHEVIQKEKLEKSTAIIGAVPFNQQRIFIIRTKDFKSF